MKLLSRKLLTLVVSVAIGLLLAEAGLRLFGWADIVLFTAHPKFNYLMTPSQEVYSYGHPVVINSLGLRGAELQQPKPADVKRILFIGDSVTYGGGRIREAQVLCRVVESLARQNGQEVEVVNLSAPGWSPQNWTTYVNERGLHEADVVVLVLPECDLVRPMMAMEQVGHESDKALLRLTNLTKKIWYIFAARHSKREVIESEVVAQNVNAVQSIRDRVGDLPFLAVLIPTHHSGDEAFWPSFESQLPEKLDLRVPLQDDSMFFDGVHLNSQGHRFVGERVFDELRDKLGLSTSTP